LYTYKRFEYENGKKWANVYRPSFILWPFRGSLVHFKQRRCETRHACISMYVWRSISKTNRAGCSNTVRNARLNRKLVSRAASERVFSWRFLARIRFWYSCPTRRRRRRRGTFPISRRHRVARGSPAGRRKIFVHVHVVDVPPVYVALRLVIGHHEYPAGPAARLPDAQLLRVGPHELRERTCETNETKNYNYGTGALVHHLPPTGTLPEFMLAGYIFGLSLGSNNFEDEYHSRTTSLPAQPGKTLIVIKPDGVLRTNWIHASFVGETGQDSSYLRFVYG